MSAQVYSLETEIALKNGFDHAHGQGLAATAASSTNPNELRDESPASYNLRYELYQIIGSEFHKNYSMTIAAQTCARNSKYKGNYTNHMGHLYGVELKLSKSSPSAYKAIVDESEACFNEYEDYIQNWQKTWTFDRAVALRNKLIAHYQTIAENSVEGPHISDLVVGFSKNTPKVLKLKLKHDTLKSATSVTTAAAKPALPVTGAAASTTAVTHTLPGYANHLASEGISGLCATAVLAGNANPSNDMGNSAGAAAKLLVRTN